MVEALIRQTARKVLKLLLPGEKPAVVFYLVSDSFIRNLNRRFRHKNKPTCVLAFPSRAPLFYPENFSRGERQLGEIFLAPDYIKKHKYDVRFLVIHSLLHLLGYDHKKKNDRIKMERKERFLMSNF